MVTTIGYGNQYPSTLEGKLFVCIFALISVPIVAFGMGQYALLFKAGIFCLRFNLTPRLSGFKILNPQAGGMAVAQPYGFE